MSANSRAVFIDKDGTLVENVPYNVNPALVRLTPGAVEGLRLFQHAGYRLIVVSNQSGVARGYFPEAALRAVNGKISALLGEHGIRISDFYYCPHDPEGEMLGYAVECLCRKPQPGLLLSAACDHGLDLAESWMIGDILNDIEAGRRAGCRTVLINNGNETEWIMTPYRKPHTVAADLREAAGTVLGIAVEDK